MKSWSRQNLDGVICTGRAVARLAVVALVSVGGLWSQNPLPVRVPLSSAQQPGPSPSVAESDLFLMNKTVSNSIGGSEGNYSNLMSILGAIGIGSPKPQTESVSVANQPGAQSSAQPLRSESRGLRENGSNSSLTFVPGRGYVNKSVTAESPARNSTFPTSTSGSSGTGARENLPNNPLSTSGSLNRVNPSSEPSNGKVGALEPSGSRSSLKASVPKPANACAIPTSVTNSTSTSCIVSPLTTATLLTYHSSDTAPNVDRKNLEKARCTQLQKEMQNASKSQQRQHKDEISACSKFVGR